MNLPNRLTLGRFVLTIFFLAALLWRARFNDTIALVLFCLAGLTDYYDGMIARRDKLITNFGTLMDPLADKILTCSAFIAFVGRGTVPAWMAIVIVAQIVAIIVLLIAESYDEWGHWAQVVLKPWVPVLAQVALTVTVILTFTSGLLYLWRNRGLYLNDM